MQSKIYGMGFLLGGLGIALGGCSPLFEGDTTTATGNNTENSLIQNEQSLEQFKIILSGEADLIEDEGYGTNYLTLLQEGNCSSYRNEEYGFQLTLPDEWNNCKLIRNVFIAPDNTILVDFTLNFFSEMNKEWKISDGELLPIGRGNPITLGIMKHSTYVNMPDWMYFGDRKGLEEANIGHNNTYYFTLTLGSASTTWFESFFPNNKKEFSCKKEGVPVKCWLIDAFTAGFLTFDI